MKLQLLGILFAIIGVSIACEHEPFPANEFPMDTTGSPMDTIGNPNDTTGNPNDTTNPMGKPCDPDTIYFERDLLPIFKATCAISGCHDAATAEDNVILDSYANVFNTADVDPFDPDGSDLYEVLIETDPDKRMPPPPRSRLTQAQIQMIQKWILQGAKNLTCNDSAGCNTDNQSFANDIFPIFQQNCVSCHSGGSPQGGRSLSNHSEITAAINDNNANLLQRINHANGVPPMPQSFKMDDCKIDKIEAWVMDGMPDN